MSRFIDADALYEKTAEWEAQAMGQLEKLNSKPFEEMDANEIAEWRKWSCILNERSAFKFDVADAPAADVRENVHGRWKGEGYGDRSCSICGSVFTVDTCMGKPIWNYCPKCGADMRERREG